MQCVFRGFAKFTADVGVSRTASIAVPVASDSRERGRVSGTIPLLDGVTKKPISIILVVSIFCFRSASCELNAYQVHRVGWFPPRMSKRSGIPNKQPTRQPVASKSTLKPEKRTHPRAVKHVLLKKRARLSALQPRDNKRTALYNIGASAVVALSCRLTHRVYKYVPSPILPVHLRCPLQVKASASTTISI